MSRHVVFSVARFGKRRMRTVLRATPAALVAVLSLMLAPRASGDVRVANDGVDGPTCGGKKTPCRSISRAIANAGAGDKVVVGPGHYGDLDGDGTLGGPGEEKLSTSCGSTGTVFNVVCIDKPVTVLSRDGAASTVIEARAVPLDDVVVVSAPGAVLGAPKKGFTIVSGEAIGVGSPILLIGSGGTVAGNRMGGPKGGIAMLGTGHVFKANQVQGASIAPNGSGHQIIGNEIADARADAISIFRCQGCRIAGNLVTRGRHDGISVVDDNPGLVVEGNVVAGSIRHGFGNFRLNDIPVSNVLFRGNIASGNGGAGFQLDGINLTLTGNVAIGNRVAGVQIDPLSAPPVLVANDFIGNGEGGNRCGVSNSSPQQVAATQSYWGAETGPGPRPADDACSDTGAGVVVTEPFAKKPHKVKPKLPRIQ